jgi:hypothetical protein
MIADTAVDEVALRTRIEAQALPGPSIDPPAILLCSPGDTRPPGGDL